MVLLHLCVCTWVYLYAMRWVNVSQPDECQFFYNMRIKRWVCSQVCTMSHTMAYATSKLRIVGTGSTHVYRVLEIRLANSTNFLPFSSLSSLSLVRARCILLMRERDGRRTKNKTFNTCVWHSDFATIRSNQSNIAAMWNIRLALFSNATGAVTHKREKWCWWTGNCILWWIYRARVNATFLVLLPIDIEYTRMYVWRVSDECVRIAEFVCGFVVKKRGWTNCRTMELICTLALSLSFSFFLIAFFYIKEFFSHFRCFFSVYISACVVECHCESGNKNMFLCIRRLLLYKLQVHIIIVDNSRDKQYTLEAAAKSARTATRKTTTTSTSETTTATTTAAAETNEGDFNLYI